MNQIQVMTFYLEKKKSTCKIKCFKMRDIVMQGVFTRQPVSGYPVKSI